LLAGHLLTEPVPAGGSILDLGAGSGLLAVLAAKQHAAEVVAIDLSLRAVLTTRVNALLNGVRVNAIRGNLFAPVRGWRFDLIVSNPPYLPTTDGATGAHSSSRAWEAGPSGRRYLDRICQEAPTHLNGNGVLLLVQSSVCGEFLTLSALEEAGLKASVVQRKRGPLGPLLRARADWLRSRSLVGEDDSEEMIVIRATTGD
jgi:release factor glutamine methyltransferase